MTTELVTRRRFLGSTSAAAASLALASSRRAVAAANAKIKLGLIGCGNRGLWIADLFRNDDNFEITATMDYFDDVARSAGEKLGVPSEKCFSGLGGFHGLLASEVEAVAIESPPYFHPQQAAAAVAAGKHVFIAKPIAVDVPGCLSIRASGAAATNAGLVFLVDFQTRAMPQFSEALRRVHAGALGDCCYGEAIYESGRLTPHAEGNSPEARLKNWVFDKALSGDIITEQNIHTLDVMNWIMRDPPVRAFGVGGRKVRTDVGDTWDHFSVLYEYANDVGVQFHSRQYNAWGAADGILNRMFGTRGALFTSYGGEVLIRGGQDNSWRGGSTDAIYQEGAVNNIRTFRQSILSHYVDNPTVEPSVHSNLITILGRTAAYEKRVVTWEEIIKSNQHLEADLTGLRA